VHDRLVPHAMSGFHKRVFSRPGMDQDCVDIAALTEFQGGSGPDGNQVNATVVRLLENRQQNVKQSRVPRAGGRSQSEHRACADGAGVCVG
jgi:hypothetical protein